MHIVRPRAGSSIHYRQLSAITSSIDAGIARRAEELFQRHQLDIYKSTDRLFAQLMFWQWIAGIIAALAISPFTWRGSHSTTHIHVWAALFLGAAINAYPIFLALKAPGTKASRNSIAIGQMLMSALLIHLTGGRIETHFHVFGSLVILSFYRDWRVLIPATVIVGLDHFIRGVYWPQSVYGVLTATPWRSFWNIPDGSFLKTSSSSVRVCAVCKRCAVSRTIPPNSKQRTNSSKRK